jgi:hypothetical protein
MNVRDFLCASVGSSAFKLQNSLGSRRVCACSQAGFNSQNGGCAWGVYHRRAAFCCAFFCGQKNLMQKIFIYKCILFTVRSVCRVKGFTTGSINYLKDIRLSQMVPDQVRKWMRHKSKDSYPAGFDALVKRWDKCINVSGGYVEK